MYSGGDKEERLTNNILHKHYRSENDLDLDNYFGM